jgi:hypothetical protein
VNNPLLTFEINDTLESIEIFADKQGIKELIRWLELVLKTQDHQHLMTPEWGGDELSSTLQGQSNRLINHVKIIPVEAEK